MSWHEANDRFLAAALERVREALVRCVPGKEKSEEPLPEPKPFEEDGYPAALTTLALTFELSAFEQDVVLLATAAELDARFGELCAQAQGDARRTQPTFGLALAAFPEAHWSALSPSGPLRRWRLLEVGRGDGLLTGPLKLEERVLHYLRGLTVSEERLAGIAEPLAASAPTPAQREIVAQVVAAWQEAAPRGPLPVIELFGDAEDAKRGIAGEAAAALGLGTLRLAASSLPLAVAEVESLLRLLGREAALGRAALYLDLDGLDATDAAREAAARQVEEGFQGPLIVACRERRRPRLRPVVPLAVEPLPIDTLPPAQRRAAQERVRQRLGQLAQRVEGGAGWDDLVLPEREKGLLAQIALHVRHRGRVHDEWGFAARSARGLGISALFAGNSGTGKTLAAEVLARELELDLFKIDLASVVSKYIGETEKNLKRVFDAAEEGGAILLFDEADALFGKRSEVKDSHDRYANIEVSYLLQRMEAYRGLAILTTNLKSALDPAFLRRLRFVVQFPFPDADSRAAIWRGIFPAATPTEALDVERLAGLQLAGGSIKNVAVGAAFLAAAQGTSVSMAHLLEAARAEYAKLEKPLTAAEIGGWR